MARKKKELGLDIYGVQKTMRASDYIGDGVGQLALTFINTLIGQLTYFYTEKVGAAAAMVATALLAPKIIDAFSDVIMGKIMDSSNSPKGKCRPWFLRMAVPAMINIILLFTIPKGASTAVQAIYIVVTNTLMTAVIFTAVSVPYCSQQALRTKSAEERGTMGIVRTIFNMVGGASISLCIIPLTNLLGGDQRAWIIFAVVIGLISCGALITTYFTEKEPAMEEAGKAKAETKESDPDADVPIAKGLSILLHNKFWVIMALVSFISSVNYGLMGGSNTYYAKYMLGDDNLTALLGLASSVPMGIGFVLVPVMNKKWGMRNSTLVCFVIGVIGNILRALFPYSFAIAALGGALSMLAMVPLMCFQGAMLNNCVEYNEWKFGHRLVGLTNSVSSFAGKISGAIGGSLIGWTLAVFGYQTGVAAELQPASVKTGVMVFSVFLPAALYIIMSFLMKFYTLEKDYGKIVAELNERKAKGQKEA